MTETPFKVISLYPYTSEEEDDLTFEANQVIQVDTIEDEEWYSGSYMTEGGSLKSGMFPKNFVKLVEQVEETPKDTEAQGSAATIEPEEPSIPVADSSKAVEDTEIATKPVEPKTNALSKKISTFNSETSAPLNPDSKPKDDNYIKKPFYASAKSSYVPPSFTKDSPAKKEESKPVPPPINASSSSGVADESAQEEEGPKMSLKERIALLQKRQQEEAEHQAELERKKQEKKEMKKKKQAAAEVEQAPPPPIPSNTTGESLVSSSSKLSTETSEPPVPPIPSVDEVVEVEDEDEEVEDEDEIEVETKSPVVVDEEFVDADEQNDVAPEEDDSEEDKQETINKTGEAEAEDDEDEDDDDNEEDSEEARKAALRERMAKLSGGVGMFGMMGVASPFGSAPPKASKDKQSEKKAVDETSFPPPQATPIAATAPPSPIPNRAVAAEKEVDETESESAAAPEVESSYISNESEDTAEEKGMEVPPVPSSTDINPSIIPRAEIQDHLHSDEGDDVTVAADGPQGGELIEESSVLDEKKETLPGSPILEMVATGYEADEDTDGPAADTVDAEKTASAAPLAPPPIPGAAPPVPEIPALKTSDIASASDIVDSDEVTSPSFAAPPIPLPNTAPPPPTDSYLEAAEPPKNVSMPEESAPPPIPPSVPSRAPVPVPAPAPAVPIPAATRRVSTDQGRKTSADLTKKSMELKRATTLSSDMGARKSVDLSEDDGWWLNGDAPPSIASEVGKNCIFEVDTNIVHKRGGRQVVYRDYYVLYHDLSQLIIEVSYSVNDPQHTVSIKEHHMKPPAPRKDKLDKASIEYGTQIVSLVNNLEAMNIGFNRLVPYIFEKLAKTNPIIPAVGYKGFGALIMKFNGPDDYEKYDEIRPGDLLCMKAKFYVHNKLRQKSVVDVGGSEVHSCVITEFDAAKDKFKVVETDHSGKIAKNSYKLSDFKSGRLRVFRVVGRDYINWS